MTRVLRIRPLLRLLLILVLAPGGAAAADEFRVDKVETRLEGDVLVMDARIDYAFSDVALEALDNGVPLTLEVHIQLRNTDAWVWEDNLVDQRLRYVIRYKPLSERYLVSLLPGDGGRSYVTRDAAIGALGEIENLQLVAKDRLEDGETYEIHLLVSLDIEELPLPLKPIAYLRPSWKLSSGWTKWPLEP
ncbi:MAG: DUF4390 domain-containing protein [Pseudomonadota bacterium]|nr:DUF4390 domain-containing protein [Pseudomonadota bacterium]